MQTQGEHRERTGLVSYLRLPEARRGLKQIPPQHLQREHGPANSSILDFWPPELCDKKFQLIKQISTQFVILCYGCPKKINSSSISHMSLTTVRKWSKSETAAYSSMGCLCDKMSKRSSRLLYCGGGFFWEHLAWRQFSSCGMQRARKPLPLWWGIEERSRAQPRLAGSTASQLWPRLGSVHTAV